MNELRLLGEIGLRGTDGDRVDSILAQPKRLALLAYLGLATPGGTQRRDRLVSVFWPDLAESNARNSLSQSLHHLRQALGSDAVVSYGTDEVGIDRGKLACDALEFLDALEAGDLETALELYRGDLLPGLLVSGSPDFERWLDGERATIRRKAFDAALELGRDAEDSGDLVSAARWYRRATAIMPEQGCAVRNLMAALAGAGMPLDAVLEFERFAARLAADYGLQPSDETRIVFESIRSSLAASGEPVSGKEGKPVRADAEAQADTYAQIEQVRGRRTPSGRPWRLAAGAAALVVVAMGIQTFATGAFRGSEAADPKAIGPYATALAVLPFANETGDPENDYLSDGITTMLISQLARFPGLERVISRASVYTYKNRQVDPRTVSEDLDVTVVVTGTMARLDTSWVLSVEVTDTRDGRHLWGDTYELTLNELLAVSERLTREIARALNLDLAEGTVIAPAGRTTLDPEAHRMYLMGLHLANQYSDNGLTQAVEHFERAIDRDPNYALPHSGLANLYSLMALFGLDEPRGLHPRARQAAERALTLDDQLAEAHMAMAEIHYLFEWDWTAAEREFQRALELDPAGSVVFLEYSAFLVMMGRVPEAIEMAKRAREVDPLSAAANHNVGWIYEIAGQHERAVEEFERVLGLFPNYAPAHGVRAWALSRLGRHAEAVAAAKRSEQLSGGDPWTLANTGYVYARAGRVDLAMAKLGELTALADERYVDPHFMAVIHSGLGDTERALEWLERAYEARSPNLTFKRDRWFPDLVADPRYQALRAQMNFPPG